MLSSHENSNNNSSPENRAGIITSSEGTGKQFWFWLGLIIICSVGLLIRLLLLGKTELAPLEIIILQTSANSRTLSHTIMSDLGPLTSSLLSMWTPIGQEVDASIGTILPRLVPVIFGGCAIVLTGILGNRVYSWKVGLIAAFIVAISIWSIRYSILVNPAPIMTCMFLITAIYLHKYYCASQASGSGSEPGPEHDPDIDSDSTQSKNGQGMFIGLGFMIVVSFFVSRFMLLLPVVVVVTFIVARRIRRPSRSETDNTSDRSRRWLQLIIGIVLFVVILLILTSFQETIQLPEAIKRSSSANDFSAFGKVFIDDLNLLALILSFGGGYLILRKRIHNASLLLAFIGVLYPAFLSSNTIFAEMYVTTLFPFFAIVIGMGLIKALGVIKARYQPLKVFPIFLILMITAGDLVVLIPGVHPYAHHNDFRSDWGKACRYLNTISQPQDRIMTDSVEIVNFYIQFRSVEAIPSADEGYEHLTGLQNLNSTLVPDWLILSTPKYSALTLDSSSWLEAAYDKVWIGKSTIIFRKL